MAQEQLVMLHDTLGLTWREIALLERYRGIPAGTLATIAKTGQAPHKWRRRLGLPDLGRITVMEGEAPDGSQALGARQCQCGEFFISNHPRRRKCYVCSPRRT
jgi:hypothetical protein